MSAHINTEAFSKAWHQQSVEQPAAAGAETSSATLDNSKPIPTAALYEPGNEELCRKLLDQAVASDPRTFTLGDIGGPLVILRVPEEGSLPSSVCWGGDVPGTTVATAADIVE